MTLCFFFFLDCEFLHEINKVSIYPSIHLSIVAPNRPKVEETDSGLKSCVKAGTYGQTGWAWSLAPSDLDCRYRRRHHHLRARRQSHCHRSAQKHDRSSSEAFFWSFYLLV